MPTDTSLVTEAILREGNEAEQTPPKVPATVTTEHMCSEL